MEASKVSPRDRVQQRCRGAALVDIPVPRGGGLHGPGSAASSSHSSGAEDEAFTGGFRTFPQHQKSARLGPHSGSELGADFNLWTMDSGGLCRLHGARGGRAGHGVGVGVGAGGGRRDSLRRWVSAFAGLHAVPGAPHGSARAEGVPMVTGAPSHTSWAELHPEASAHEQELALYLPD